MFSPGKAPHIGILVALSALILAQSARSPTELGRQALDFLLAEKYSELSGMFSDMLKHSVTLEFLQQRVSAELKEFGQPQNIGEAVLAVQGTDNLVSFPVKFSNTSIHVQFTLNQSGQIAGMYFRPPDKPLPAIWQRPSYSKPESFRERELTIGSDKWKLGGTLTA